MCSRCLFVRVNILTSVLSARFRGVGDGENGGSEGGSALAAVEQHCCSDPAKAGECGCRYWRWECTKQEKHRSLPNPNPKTLSGFIATMSVKLPPAFWRCSHFGVYTGEIFILPLKQWKDTTLLFLYVKIVSLLLVFLSSITNLEKGRGMFFFKSCWLTCYW